MKFGRFIKEASFWRGGGSLTINSFCWAIGFFALAGCSANPTAQHFAAKRGSDIDPRYGVRASPRVVADGEPVPKGGGSYLVGKPYAIAGRTYYPTERPGTSVGLASYYGMDFHGRRTANGEIFDRMSISAAHPTMPLPSYARVTNLRNSHSIVVRVNDRGPYHENRVMDVSERVAEALKFKTVGTTPVKVEWLGRASLSGSDDARLLASLREDGRPARLDGGDAIMLAQEQQPAPYRTAALAKHPPVENPIVASDADDEEAPAPRKAAVEKRTAFPTPSATIAAPKPVVAVKNIASAKASAKATPANKSGEPKKFVAPAHAAGQPKVAAAVKAASPARAAPTAKQTATAKAAPVPPARPDEMRRLVAKAQMRSRGSLN